MSQSKRIYVATSWRNDEQPRIVSMLRRWGHEVYDFRNPKPNDHGFSWLQVSDDWESWTTDEYRWELLHNPIAAQGYMNDIRALEWCDTCLLLQPCGRSAHLELGYAAGRGKHTIIYLKPGEPELMALIADNLVVNDSELKAAL